MYKAFYNLKRNPFEIIPDPSFLFATPRHNEAMAALYHGVRAHKGFVVLTGEVGTGKTLLLRCLLDLFTKADDIAYAYVFNGRLSPFEFLQYVASDFGLSVSGKNKGEILLELSNYVVGRGTSNLTTVLIVDEAHHLSADILEEIRLLTNLETSYGKLLQILLVGQPELNDTLDSPDMRQLKQRISHRAHLLALDANDTKGYILRRLAIAGCTGGAGASLFPDDAIASVFRHSNGIPRLINTICENALITAYARKVKAVTPDIVDSAASDLRLDVVYLPQAAAAAEFDETLARRASKTLLELFAYLKKTSVREEEQDHYNRAIYKL